MPRNAKTQAPVIDRRVDVARLYLQGQTQTAIAKQLGVTQQTISLDLKAIQTSWRESAIRDFDFAKARELAKLDNLEREFWTAWHRSIGKYEIETVKASEKHGAEKTVRTEDLNGDPRYLQGALECIKKRCQILGIDAPTQIDVTLPPTNITYKRVTSVNGASNGAEC